MGVGDGWFAYATETGSSVPGVERMSVLVAMGGLNRWLKECVENKKAVNCELERFLDSALNSSGLRWRATTGKFLEVE